MTSVLVSYCYCNGLTQIRVLKLHKFIILHFHCLDIKNGSPWAEIKVLATTVFQGLKGKSASLLFPLLEAILIPWLATPNFYLQSQKRQVESFLHWITLNYS